MSLLPRFAAVAAVLAMAISGCTAPSGGYGEGDFWNPPSLSADRELPEARGVVQNMLTFVGQHDEGSAEVLLTYEAVQESGRKLHFDVLQRLAYSRSTNRALWMSLRDDGSTDTGWIVDGTFRFVKQPANLYAELDGPDALPDMIRFLAEDYEIDIPAEDLFSGNGDELWLGEGASDFIYIGEAFVRGRWTDHVALSRPGVDIELWVEIGDRPVPARISAVFTEIDGNPGWTAEFLRYSDSLPDPGVLDLTIPEDAERVELAPAVPN